MALPLYNELRQAILAQAEAQTQLVQILANQLDQVESLLQGTAAPATQAAELEAQIAALTPAALVGTVTPEQMDELIALNQQLLQLGESTDNLALQQQAIDNLTVVQQLLEQQLVAVAGTTDADAALRAIQEEALAELQALNSQLEALFISQQAVQESLQLPVPVVITQPAAVQMGGLVGYTNGGHVPAKLEPGELVYPGLLRPMTAAALDTVNRTFPRFQVGGRWAGDTVPALLPTGSFVLNRRAAGVVQGQGFQAGGTVQGHGSPTSVHVGPFTIHVHIHGSNADPKLIAQEVYREFERKVVSTYQRRNIFP